MALEALKRDLTGAEADVRSYDRLCANPTYRGYAFIGHAPIVLGSG